MAHVATPGLLSSLFEAHISFSVVYQVCMAKHIGFRSATYSCCTCPAMIYSARARPCALGPPMVASWTQHSPLSFLSPELEDWEVKKTDPIRAHMMLHAGHSTWVLWVALSQPGWDRCGGISHPAHVAGCCREHAGSWTSSCKVLGCREKAVWELEAC